VHHSSIGSVRAWPRHRDAALRRPEAAAVIARAMPAPTGESTSQELAVAGGPGV
jgi:hypothetical protein